ncbi:MAG: lasso peptide biosynthesis B2 protein [Gemmatimonadales bacterium]
MASHEPVPPGAVAPPGGGRRDGDPTAPERHVVRPGRLVSRGEPDAAPAEADGLDDTSLARWVDGLLRRLRGPWRHTCLKRAAVLYHLLRRAGRPVELCIGVRRNGGGALAAHAWLVRDGIPYLEREPVAAQAHTVIARFPERATP